VTANVPAIAPAPFRPAVPDDVSQLVALQATYYAEDGYLFDDAVSRSVWRALLADSALGAAWVAAAGDAIVAYVVVTLGYSLEYRGRDAFVDAVYDAPGWRGAGLGRQAMAIAEAACRARGVRALHLEVEAGKPRARALYESRGFADRGRVLMTKRLVDDRMR
jgi:GNAT superfamily N-acetyltransferase